MSQQERNDAHLIARKDGILTDAGKLIGSLPAEIDVAGGPDWVLRLKPNDVLNDLYKLAFALDALAKARA